jgi:hypothetical protein
MNKTKIKEFELYNTIDGYGKLITKLISNYYLGEVKHIMKESELKLTDEQIEKLSIDIEREVDNENNKNKILITVYTND